MRRDDEDIHATISERKGKTQVPVKSSQSLKEMLEITLVSHSTRNLPTTFTSLAWMRRAGCRKMTSKISFIVQIEHPPSPIVKHTTNWTGIFEVAFRNGWGWNEGEKQPGQELPIV